MTPARRAHRHRQHGRRQQGVDPPGGVAPARAASAAGRCRPRATWRATAAAARPSRQASSARPDASACPQEPQGVVAASAPCPPAAWATPRDYAKLVGHIIENDILNDGEFRLDGAIRLAPKSFPFAGSPPRRSAADMVCMPWCTGTCRWPAGEARRTISLLAKKSPLANQRAFRGLGKGQN